MKGGSCKCVQKRLVFLSWRWYFNGVGVSEGGFNFVNTLGIGIVEWQRIHVGELKAELRRGEDCTVEVW